MQVLPGESYPLGATLRNDGVNFSLFSRHATRVELCLFDSPSSTKETTCLPLNQKTHDIWHGFVPGIKAGQLYGYRVYGPYAPHEGMRYNPHKIVIDPYGKAVGRNVRWSDSMFGYRLGDPAGDLSFDSRDNSADCPLSAVIDDTFRWGNDKPLRTPWNKTFIYEMHVKGFTHLNKAIPANIRGTYAGLCSKQAIQHLLSLGVTAVELLPVHHKLDDQFLFNKGLTNYWGYNTLSYFAPETTYASETEPQNIIREFKRMVRRLHQAGIEVLLDVVYNHTAEGNELGPTLSLRGIDNAAYYRLVPGNARYYRDYTGCGNTLNTMTPEVLQLIMDSLRYWVQEMRIDGFRFDLTSAIGREAHHFDRFGAFFDIIHQDPVLSQVKLIAEPWDLGEGGYQVGNYPIHWSEWNGKYRDCMRRYWRGDMGMISEFATRLTGSSDLYQHNGRKTGASVNFITSHDGFSLHDLVSYQHKHNLANGEENRDGDNHNLSWNCGTEGETTDKNILSLRERQKKNMLTTLFCSLGVPMLRMGDEISHTQNGNNNAYCQDNEINWMNWNLSPEQQKYFDFVKKLVQLWKTNPTFQKHNFFLGEKIRGKDVPDISWFTPAGDPMSMQDWDNGMTKCLGVRIEGNMPTEVDATGKPVDARTFVLLFNASQDAIRFMLPETTPSQFWRPEIDTSGKASDNRWLKGKAGYLLESHSMAVIRLKTIQNKIATKLINWLNATDATSGDPPLAGSLVDESIVMPDPVIPEIPEEDETLDNLPMQAEKTGSEVEAHPKEVTATSSKPDQ